MRLKICLIGELRFLIEHRGRWSYQETVCCVTGDLFLSVLLTILDNRRTKSKESHPYLIWPGRLSCIHAAQNWNLFVYIGWWFLTWIRGLIICSLVRPNPPPMAYSPQFMPSGFEFDKSLVVLRASNLQLIKLNPLFWNVKCVYS